MPDRIAYKVMTAAQAALMVRDGAFHGAPIDIADGYIHLSSAAQLAATVRKHFAGVDGLVLAAVDLARLGDTVRWEPSRGGDLFPHLYGALRMQAVLAVAPLERVDDESVASLTAAMSGDARGER